MTNVVTKGYLIKNYKLSYKRASLIPVVSLFYITDRCLLGLVRMPQHTYTIFVQSPQNDHPLS